MITRQIEVVSLRRQRQWNETAATTLEGAVNASLAGIIRAGAVIVAVMPWDRNLDGAVISVAILYECEA